MTEHRKHRVGPGWSRDDGLSIVELLVALVIVMIAFAALASTLIASFASIRNSEARVRAVALANELVEEMAEIPYDRLGLLDDDLVDTYGFLPVDFEGEELVMLFGDEQKVVEHRHTVERDGRDFEVERWVTWFEEDGGQDLKRIVATVTWEVGGDVQTVRSETLRAPDAQDLLDLEVSVDVRSNNDYENAVSLKEPGGTDDFRSEDTFVVRATMGVVPAEIELRFVNRDNTEIVRLGPTADYVGEKIVEWTAGGLGDGKTRFRHGRHAFTVYATGADDRIASATGTLRFYQNVRIDPDEDSLEVLQNGSPLTTDPDGTNPRVLVDRDGVLCGPVTVESDVHGMTGGEATPTAVEGEADDEVGGGLTLHIRRASDITSQPDENYDWGWANDDPVVMRLLHEKPFGGTYMGELGVDYLPELDLANPPVAVTLRADRRAVHKDFDDDDEIDVAAVEVVTGCT